MTASKTSDNAIYKLPDPQQVTESERLDLQHQVFLLSLSGSLTSVPLRSPVRGVLDIGCGTGAWPTAFARAHPSASVVGIDISPPAESPPSQPNVRFHALNLEQHAWAPALPTEPVDLVHARMLTIAIRDWPGLLAKSYAALAPGGFFETVDFTFPWRADVDGLGPEQSTFLKLGTRAEASWRRVGVDTRASEHLSEDLGRAGFIDVQQTEFRWPVGWSDDESGALAARMTLENYRRFIGAAGKTFLSEEAGVVADEAEADAFSKVALADLEENHAKNRYFVLMRISVGRKPAQDEH